MTFLKGLFWIVLTLCAVVFAAHNWTVVTVNLWGGLQADFKLPVLLLVAFLIGFLPAYAVYHATRWRYRRRLATTERALIAPPPVASDPPGAPLTVAPGSAAPAPHLPEPF